MGVMFQDNSQVFQQFAKKDYDVFKQAYGDDDWDLIDSDKKQFLRWINDGLVCYCYIVDQVVSSNPK